MLSFDEFRATRKDIDDLSTVRDDSAGPGVIYVAGDTMNDNLFIERSGDIYYLTIENQQWEGSDISLLEPHLYEYYVGECQ